MRCLRRVLLLLVATCALVIPVAALAESGSPSQVRFTGADNRPNVDANAQPLQITPDQEAAFKAAGPPPINPGALPSAPVTRGRSLLSMLGMLGGAGIAGLFGVVWNLLELRRLETSLTTVRLAPASGLRAGRVGTSASPVALMCGLAPEVPHVVVGAPAVLTLPTGCREPGPDHKAPPEIGISVGGRNPEDYPQHNDEKGHQPKDAPNHDLPDMPDDAPRDIEGGRVYGPPDMTPGADGQAWLQLQDIVTGALSGNTTMFTDRDAQREQHRLDAAEQRAKDAEQGKQGGDGVGGQSVSPSAQQQEQGGQQENEGNQHQGVRADPDAAEQQAKAHQEQQLHSHPVPASQLPSFEGKTADEIRAILVASGYQNTRPPGTPTQSDIWYEPTSGSQVRIDEYGNGTTRNNDGDDPHVHKEQIEPGLSSTSRIKSIEANVLYDDQGNPSTDRDTTHISIALPSDFEAITGRTLRRSNTSRDTTAPDGTRRDNSSLSMTAQDRTTSQDN